MTMTMARMIGVVGLLAVMTGNALAMGSSLEARKTESGVAFAEMATAKGGRTQPPRANGDFGPASKTQAPLIAASRSELKKPQVPAPAASENGASGKTRGGMAAAGMGGAVGGGALGGFIGYMAASGPLEMLFVAVPGGIIVGAALGAGLALWVYGR